jgi:hypothetical protein
MDKKNIIKQELKALGWITDPNKLAIWTYSKNKQTKAVICSNSSSKKEVMALINSQEKGTISSDDIKFIGHEKILYPASLSIKNQRKPSKTKSRIKKEDKTLLPIELSNNNQSLKQTRKKEQKQYEAKLREDKKQLQEKNIRLENENTALNKQYRSLKSYRNKYEDLSKEHEAKIIEINQLNNEIKKNTEILAVKKAEIQSEIYFSQLLLDEITLILKHMSLRYKDDSQIIKDRSKKSSAIIEIFKVLSQISRGDKPKWDKVKDTIGWFKIRGTVGGHFGDDSRIRIYFCPNKRRVTFHYKENDKAEKIFQSNLL